MAHLTPSVSSPLQMSPLVALGMLELCSVAQGLVVQDYMLKKAHVHLRWARVYNPGKYLILIEGGEDEVYESLKKGKEIAQDFLIDSLNLPHPHSQLRPLFDQDTAGVVDRSLGIIECASLCATVRSADAALKETDITPIALRLDPTLGGKGCFLFSGLLEDVQASLERAKMACTFPFLYHTQLIANPHPELPTRLYTNYPPTEYSS
jgi:microcompartment protein CcmL/EutN